MGRHTMSFLLLTPQEAVLLDAGTGAARLLDEQIAHLVESYDCLNVILSHYHLDHIVGLAYLSGAWTRGSIRIFAPGRPLVEAEPAETLNRLLSPPLFSPTLADFPVPTEVVPLTSESLKIGDLTVEVRRQKHPGGSIGIRIADAIGYITDTIVDEATVELVRGTKLLLHEVWLTDSEAKCDEEQRSMHSYLSGVAQIVRRAGVSEFMPVHHKPKRSHADICNMAKELEVLAGIKVTVPLEGEVYQLI